MFDIFLLQKAFRFNLDLSQLLAILVISSFALSIQSAPGMVGTFHMAVLYTLVELYGYSVMDGNSFAIVMHAYGFILFTIIGAYFFVKSQFK